MNILDILPQRPPFLFVDTVVSTDVGNGSIVCRKNFTLNEYFFAGHFPGNPVVPGVIMVEALAQSAILLYAALKPEIAAQHPNYYLGKVEVKFSRLVIPGDELMLEVTSEKIIATAGIVSVCAKVGNEIAVEGRMSFGVKL